MAGITTVPPAAIAASAPNIGMPGAAIQTGCVDFVLPLAEIASDLVTLVTQQRNHERNER